MVAVGGWDACGNRFYSKSELYQMGWTDIMLDNLRSFLPCPAGACSTKCVGALHDIA